MTPEAFKRYCDLVLPCFMHNGWHDYDPANDYWGGRYHKEGEPYFHQETYDNVREHARQALAYFDCPEAWMPMVMLCTEGVSYYGYEAAILGEGN